MRNSTSQKVVVGLFTLVPILGLVAYIYTILDIMLPIMSEQPFAREPMPSDFIPMFIAIGIVALSSIGLLIYYIIDVYKNPAIREDMRIVWLLIVLFARIIGMAIYYFMYIVGDPPPARNVNQRGNF